MELGADSFRTQPGLIKARGPRQEGWKNKTKMLSLGLELTGPGLGLDQIFVKNIFFVINNELVYDSPNS